MRILFIDAVCPKPYAVDTLRHEPLGGSEATLIRIAEGLAARGISVHVAQHCRTEAAQYGAAYRPFGHAKDFNPTHVIVMRSALPLHDAKKQFPNAKFYVWYHDFFEKGEPFNQDCRAMCDVQALPICVSEYHKQVFATMSQASRFSIPCKRIYNPIDDELRPDSTPVDVNKMVFFSSPHKGLDQTLEVFRRFRDFPELRDVKLYISNPGYYASKDTGGITNVINLGSLPHHRIIEHVRQSLCVFHYNRVFPETFGLVHAESNAVGTPFLTGNLGASRELMDHPHECIELDDVKGVIERLIQWKTKGRPAVRGNTQFRLKSVLREWLEFLKVTS